MLIIERVGHVGADTRTTQSLEPLLLALPAARSAMCAQTHVLDPQGSSPRPGPARFTLGVSRALVPCSVDAHPGRPGSTLRRFVNHTPLEAGLSHYRSLLHGLIQHGIGTRCSPLTRRSSLSQSSLHDVLYMDAASRDAAAGLNMNTRCLHFPAIPRVRLSSHLCAAFEVTCAVSNTMLRQSSRGAAGVVS